jgi:hypothetical protein
MGLVPYLHALKHDGRISGHRSVMSVNDERDSYLLSLQALELASDRVQTACKGDDIKQAAIEAHFGLHAVYDLHEAYFRPRKITGYALQDQVLDVTGGWAVGGLAIARGQRTHHLVTFPRTGGFGDSPHGMGPYGPGWIWKKHSWGAPRATSSSKLVYGSREHAPSLGTP